MAGIGLSKRIKGIQIGAALAAVWSLGAAPGTAMAEVPGHDSQVAQIWGACGIRTPDDKVVRTFERYRGAASREHTLKGGTSNLVCGHPQKGYRHILKDHRSQWESDASIEGANWRDHADWSIEVTLRDPQVVTYRAGNNSYCYSHLIQLWDKAHRRHVTDRFVIVVVSGDNADIITAYPSDSYCS